MTNLFSVLEVAQSAYLASGFGPWSEKARTEFFLIPITSRGEETAVQKLFDPRLKNVDFLMLEGV